LTQETRVAVCASKKGKIFDDSFCVADRKPELMRPCKSKACEYSWFSSQWSKCSADCGKGTQTRSVVCGRFDGEFIRRADSESSCSKDDKPEAQRDCEIIKECPGQWFVGPWSDCSKPCGSGLKTRTVLCISNNNQSEVSSSQCKEQTIEFSSEDCNKHACSEDDIVPVDKTSKPIEEDDEGEDWCDEDYEDDYDDSLGITKVMPSDATGVSDGIDLDRTDTTVDSSDSSFITDEVMKHDWTETVDYQSDSTDFPGKLNFFFL